MQAKNAPSAEMNPEMLLCTRCMCMNSHESRKGSQLLPLSPELAPVFDLVTQICDRLQWQASCSDQAHSNLRVLRLPRTCHRYFSFSWFPGMMLCQTCSSSKQSQNKDKHRTSSRMHWHEIECNSNQHGNSKFPIPQLFGWYFCLVSS